VEGDEQGRDEVVDHRYDCHLLRLLTSAGRRRFPL
jgi:hypothetical protein